MPKELLTPAGRALRCPQHLACVRGPDLGCVIPLEPGAVVGRQTMRWLSDSVLPRLGWIVSQGRGQTLELQPVSGAGTAIPLRIGSTVRLGSGAWQVRSRPGRPSWPLPNTDGRNRKWLRFLPLVLIVGLLLRFLPGSWVLKGGLLLSGLLLVVTGLCVRRLRQRRAFDGAALALCAETKAPNSVTPSVSAAAGNRPWSAGPATVYQGKWGGRRVSVGPGEMLAVLGREAPQTARWLGAQLLLSTSEVPLVAPAKGRWEEALEPGQTAVLWGERLEDFPSRVRQVIPAKAPVSGKWLLSGPFPAYDSARDGGVPEAVSLDRVGIPVSSQDITKRWESFTYTWNTPVAARAGGKPVYLSLPADGPHALLAGATGSGKTVALQTWLWSLVTHAPPHSLRLVLIDYKGGAGLLPLADTPHAEVFTSDLDPGRTAWVLRRLGAVLQERKDLLRTAGLAEIGQWEARWVRGVQAEPPPPRILVVVDEFQVLHEEHPDLMGAFTRLAAQGRSLGLHLIFATQRPGQAVGADLRGTVDLRVALRFTEALDSQTMVGNAKAARLPPIPGRAIVADKEVQFAYGPAPELPVTSYAGPRHWPEPLPDKLDSLKLPAKSLGVREGTGPCSPLRQVPLPRGALLFSGPGLEELADVSLWTAQRMAAVTGMKLEAIVPGELGLAEVSLLLTQAARSGAPALWVSDLSELAEEFEFHGLGPEFAQLWRHLVGRAERESMPLVACDSVGSQFARVLRQRLTRIPSAEHWHHPAVLRTVPQLPRLGTSLAGASALTREEAVCSGTGRFVASGFPFERPFLIQTATNPVPGSTSPRPSFSAPNCIPGSWSRDGPLGHREVPSRVTAFGTTDQQVRWLETLGWKVDNQEAANPLLALSATQPWLYVRPPVELLRALAGRHPEDALWLRALYPYPQGQGVLVTEATVEPVCLQPQVGNGQNFKPCHTAIPLPASQN